MRRSAERQRVSGAWAQARVATRCVCGADLGRRSWGPAMAAAEGRAFAQFASDSLFCPEFVL